MLKNSIDTILRFCYVELNQRTGSIMKTLRKFLESKCIKDEISTEDIDVMAERLGIDFKFTDLKIGERRRHITDLKAKTILNQFQIQFGLDEEF